MVTTTALRQLPPRAVPRVWGVDAASIAPWFPDLPITETTGEIWFDADAAGILSDPNDPLLIKFIFAAQTLSVQVHPDDAYARERHGASGKSASLRPPRGKSEMWHVLAAQPGARIAAGFKRPLARSELRPAAESGEIEQLLEWFEARPGDTFYIPAGTVHAIGGGLTLVEIQQNSDFTYRLYDWGRGNRPLHLDEAEAVAQLGRCDARRPVGENPLVSCSYFTTERHEIDGTREFAATGTDLTHIVLAGEGKIGGNPVASGQAWRIAAQSGPVTVSGTLSILTTWPVPQK